MSAENFAPALKAVLVHEGGYTNHPKDPGGVTLEGIIQRVYDGYRKSKGLATRPLKASMRGTAAWEVERDEIYRRDYWEPSRCSDLPPGVDYAVFDQSVNSGVGQSAKWLQRAVGVKADGIIGELTVQAALTAPDKAAVVQSMCDQRLAMLQSLSTWGTFGRGWKARVDNVRRAAVAMARQGATGVNIPAKAPPEETAKASEADRSLSSIAKTPEGLAGGLAIGTSLINAASDPGPLQWALAAVVLVAVIVGAVYFVRRQRAAS